jgi:hypothetical protein
METDPQTIASRKTVKDKQPLNLTKEAGNPQAGATGNCSLQIELRRKWGVETAPFRLIHARKF